MKSVVVLITAMLFAMPLHAQVADERATLRLAQVYEQAGKFEDALRYYQDLYSASPSNATYFEGMRRVLSALKRYPEAIALITERLRTTPSDATLYVHRGGMHVLAGAEDSAKADWEKAIGVNKNNAQTYSQIADHCVNSRLYDLAITYLRRGREALRSPQLFAFEIARANAMKMNYEGAIDEYVQYLRAAPQALYQIQQQIAMYSDIPEAIDAAVRTVQRAARRHSDDVTIRHLLSWLYQERKDYAAAYLVVREIDALQKAGGMEVFRFAARAFDEKAYDVAVRAYRDVIDANPKANFLPQAEYYYARSVEALHDAHGMPDALTPSSSGRTPGTEAIPSYQGAIALYEEVARKYKGQVVESESLYRIGYIKFSKYRDNVGALDILREISSTRARVFGKADANVLIGEILTAKGDIDGALEQFSSVLRSAQLTESDRLGVTFKIAELFFFQGQFDTAITILQPLTENVTTDIANDALELTSLMQIYRQPGEMPLQRYADALFLERQHKLSQAAEGLADVIATYSSADIQDLAYLRRARILQRMGRYTDAAMTYRDFMRKRSESFMLDRGLFFLAELSETNLGDTAGALSLYQQLLNEHPNSPFAPAARDGIVRLRKGDS